MLTVDSQDTVSSERQSFKPVHLLVVFAFLTGAVFLAFGNALSGSFLADDAWHLPTVYRAFHGEPQLIWGQFMAPYGFRESLYIMYRPLVDISFALDYMMWKLNPFGYHLTNLIVHAINACQVFIASRLILQYFWLKDDRSNLLDKSISWKIPLLVSIAFAVYPGQSEPVCWILPRIDTIAAGFYYASLIGALKFLINNHRRWFAVSFVFLVLGLLTKEMCATLPIVLLALQVVNTSGILRVDRDDTLRKLDSSNVPNQQSSSVEVKKWNLAKFCTELFSESLRIWPMFALLAVYLVVRTIALGTPTGGYVGALGQYLNMSYAHRLLGIEAYWKLLHPINKDILGNESIPDTCLRILYFCMAGLLSINFLKTPCMRLRLRMAGFLMIVLFIMFLPCVQIWLVTDGMIGTRLFYSLCLPFFLALALLLHPVVAARFATGAVKPLRIASYILFAIFSVISISVSMQYAQAWSTAGNTVSQIREKIVEKVSELPPDRKLVIINLPPEITGMVAFFSIDFLPGLLKPGMTEKDLTDRVICVDGAPINGRLINFARLNELVNQPDKYDFIEWIPRTREFHTVAFPTVLEVSAPAEIPLQVRRIGTFAEVDVNDKKSSKSVFGNDRQGDHFDSYLLMPPMPINPFDADFLEVKLKMQVERTEFEGALNKAYKDLPWVKGDFENVETDKGIQNLCPNSQGMLSWNSQLYGTGDFAIPLLPTLYDTEDTQTLRVNLTEYKRWIMAGQVVAFRLDLPHKKHTYTIESARLDRSGSYIPKLKFAGKGFLNLSGLHETDNANLIFNFDASTISNNPKRVLVEISKPYGEWNFTAGTFREKKPSKFALHSMTLDRLTGEFVLPLNVVQKPAYYQVRVAALDDAGRIVGTFSDPVTVATIHDQP